MVEETPRLADDAGRTVDLRATRVAKAFAGVQALRGVSCEVGRGEIVGLIGPNGAGKTTLFNCLTGFLRIDAGEIWLGGERIDAWNTHRIAQVGVVRTFQNIRMFPDLTAFESVVVAQHAREKGGLASAVVTPWRHRRRLSHMFDKADDILDRLGLSNVRRKLTSDLTLLQQRKLELGRAIAAEPTVLLLDEPSAGATASEAEELMEVVSEINGRGMSVLLIEHNMPFVIGLARRITVMNFGEIVATGTADEIRSNPLVQKIYLGT